METSNNSWKFGYVGIVGRPNVGKSTILNTLLKSKVSIISPKAQTTRSKIIGILTGDNYQICFFDTPGYIIEPAHELHNLMLLRIKEVVEDADILLFVVEPFRIEEGDLKILEEIKRVNKITLLVINKIDLIKKEELLPLLDQWSKKYDFVEYVPISALQLDNVDLLLNLIVKYLPQGKPHYSEDILTTRTERFIVQEIIREKIFHLYKKEIPYSTAVEIDEFKENDPQHGNKDYIRAIIYVEHNSQKGIVIGRNGEALKRVGIKAREEIETFLGRPVFLELWVKVKKNWKKDRAFLKSLGY